MADWFDVQNQLGEQDRDQYSDAQWQAWRAEEEARRASGTSANQSGACPPNKPFTSRPGPDGRRECAFKPDDCPEGSHVEGTPGKCVSNSGGGGGGGGRAAAGAPAGTAGAAPTFTAPQFVAPKFEDVVNDPGFQARLATQQRVLENSQAARGMTRTGGSLADLLQLGQDYASAEYGNAYNRAANTFGLNYQGARDEFAPKYGAWQTMYGGDLSRWTTGQNNDLSRWQTQYGGNLSRDLQREQQIYGVLNQPAPSWG